MVSYRNYLYKRNEVLTQLKIVKKLKLCALQLQIQMQFNTISTFISNITILA